MKKKGLYILLILLLAVNTVLLALIIKDVNNDEKKGPPKPHFLSKELQFTEKQEREFKRLDSEHRNRMMAIDDELGKLRNQLFNSLSDSSVSKESLSVKIGELTSKRDVELFGFFKQVREICDSDQKIKFDQIIEKAIQRGPGPPRKPKRRPPPENF